MKYVYPAIFTEEEKGYSVYFPDLEGCYTCGDDLKDALMMAEDILAFTLYDYETDKKELPPASNLHDIAAEENEFINYIQCDTLEYRKRHNNSLQEALKHELGI